MTPPTSRWIYGVFMLLDVTDIPMAELVASTNPVLGRCVQRLVASLDDPDGIISAFQSNVE